MPRDDRIFPGQRVRLRVTTVDPKTREAKDVGALLLSFLDPNDVVTEINMTSTEVGKYEGSHVVDSSGHWYSRIEGTTAGNETSFEIDFEVERSEFS